MKILSQIIILGYLLGSACTSPENPLVVKTTNGLISGIKNGNLRIFKGIPFAKPPVGDLRWKAPQPAENWEGVLECTQFSASPIQPKPTPLRMWTEEFFPPVEPLSEDCLYLNVWTAAKSKEERRPVLVWIHGGGFITGSGSCAIYNGDGLAEKGLVYVTLNYRLGAFGFMAHPELSSESGKNASGNYAFMDIIMALEWVKENIAQFGGDPGNVTIAGQSAGSMAVNVLLGSPLAKGLFHQAIAQSGGILGNRVPQMLSQGEQQGLKFMEATGASDLESLRKISAADLYEQSVEMGRFGPVRDDYVIPVDVKERFESGRHNDVPMITGWVLGDAFLGDQPATMAEFAANAEERYGEDLNEFMEIFPANTDQEAVESAGKSGRLSNFGMASHFLAKYNKNKTYMYEYTYVPTDKPGFPNYGAFHSAELGYALHSLKYWDRPWQPIDYEVQEYMSDFWVNFAKTGNPNGQGVEEWKAYGPESGDIMVLGETPALSQGLYKKEFAFFERHME